MRNGRLKNGKMQIILTIETDQPPVLPLSYNYMLQSAIYAKLREVGASDFPHDTGYGTNRRFKAFVFGPLTGRYSIEDKNIIFSDGVTLEIRSPVFGFCDALQRSIEREPYLALAGAKLRISGMRVENKHIEGGTVLFETLSPAVARMTLESGKTIYYSPYDSGFAKRVSDNFRRKFAACTGREPAPVIVRPVGSFKKTVTRYKGLWITAWSGRFETEGESEQLEFIYNAGLGEKNSQGFGMVRQR